jgi:S1-C subfamily serine protease
MKRAIQKVELQKADLEEQLMSHDDRLMEMALENSDLRHKLMVTALGLSLSRARSPCLVGRVVAGSPAAKAGIAAGDVILSINGEPLPENDGHLEEAIPRYFGQPRVDFALRRGSRLITVTVDLPPRSMTETSSAAMLNETWGSAAGDLWH